MNTEWNAWNYRDSVARVPDASNILGYHVHAVDGDIGKIDDTTNVVDDSKIVVDTGPWIFGRRVLLPAGVIERIDDENEMVYVDLTKDQIKGSPELLPPGALEDPTYRSNLGLYYGGLYM